MYDRGESGRFLYVDVRQEEQQQTLFNDLRQDITAEKDNYIDFMALK